MNNNTFASKLAQKHQVKTDVKSSQWKAREGISVAGCTMSSGLWADVRGSHRVYGSDRGMYC